MLPRRLLLAGVSALALAAGVATTATTASAAPSPTGVERSDRRVCADPQPGFAECNAHVVTNAQTGRPLATAGPTGYSALQLQTAYGPFGSGAPLVAVVDAYANPNAAADLAAYRSAMHLPATNLTQLNQSGGSITTVSADVGWGQEEMLDLEMVSAICPACPILYVGASSNSFNDLAAAVDQAAKQRAKVISNSYGGREFSTETSVQSHYNIPGVAVTVSSGDNGYGVEFPASAQFAIAVGGTSLSLDSAGNRLAETVWSGAGSGCSAYVQKPTWQKDTACSRRTVADIAAVADPATGVSVYDSYGSTGGANWYVFGGTSVAAPLVGAVYATYNVPVGTSGYAVQNSYANHASLFDVISGTNGRCTTGRKSSAGSYLCTGVTGYDGPTGNGTPEGNGSPF